MIKVVLTGKDGSKHLLLGMTARNIEKLQDGQPIHIDGDALGFPADIGIFAGETTDDIVAMLLLAGMIDEKQAAEMRTYFRDDD